MYWNVYMYCNVTHWLYVEVLVIYNMHMDFLCTIAHAHV